MEMFGLDIVSILITAGFVAFWGGLLIAFFLFYDKNPYVPRKYFKVKIKNKQGYFLKFCKGWIVTTKKVKYFRVALTQFSSFKAVELDIATMEIMDDEGVITLIENIPNKYEPSNYTPVTVPITQIQRFENEVIEAVVKPLCIQDYEENGEKKQGYNQALVEHYSLKIKDALVKNSRVTDLNTSKATKEYLAQARRESERVAGDDFISKYGPLISLIIAGLFAYLIIDGSIKAYQSTMGAQNQVMENGYNQVIQQCGGVYRPINQVNNSTSAPSKPGVQIPFVNT